MNADNTGSVKFKARVEAELAPIRNHLAELRAEMEALQAESECPELMTEYGGPPQ